MGIFKRKPVWCPADEWTRIIFDFGKGFPKTMNVTLEVSSGEVIEGEYKETHYNWIFPKKPIIRPVLSSMKFSRRWIDGIYSVDIKPSTACMAHVK